MQASGHLSRDQLVRRVTRLLLVTTSVALITSACVSLSPATEPASTTVPTRSIAPTSTVSETPEPSVTAATESVQPTATETTEAPTTASTTCEALIPEVVRISKESENDVKVLQVYRPKTKKDRHDAYSAGKLKVPDGKTQVTVLSCSGTAALSDNTTVKLDFSMAYDLNDDAYVAFRPIGDPE